MSEKTEGRAPNSRRDSPFLQFVTSLEGLPKQITDAMIRQAADEDHKGVIGMYGEALRE
jgi:hypothetical protein